MPKISKRSVDALIAAGKPGSIRDDMLKGFAARLNRDGSITYLFEYRAGRSRSAPWRRLSIGRHGMFTPTTAREAAEELQSRVRLGEDPALDRARARTTPTVLQFATAFLQEADVMAIAHPEKAKLRPRTIATYRSYLRVHVAPALGSRRLDTLTRRDLELLHQAIGQRHPATANRVIEFLGTLWRAASTLQALPPNDNPARSIRAFKEMRRERYLTPEEMMRLGAAIHEAEATGIPMAIDPDKPSSKHVPRNPERRRVRIDPFAAAALRLLLFSGARLREILHAKWADVDLERALLTVFSKTGRRHVFLPPPAIAILTALPRHGEYVIPGHVDGKPRADLNRPWRMVARRARLEGVRLHDLRHSFASVAVSNGATLPIIGRLLGHTQPQTTMRYAHLADDPLREVARRTAQSIQSAFQGG
jgi:integrase